MVSRRGWQGALFVLATLLLGGCSVIRVGPAVDVVWPTMSEEFYRLEGHVCSLPTPIEGPSGLLLGLRFTIVKQGSACESHGRTILVSAGYRKAMKRCQRLRTHQRVVVVGKLEGASNDVLVARKLVVHRR